MSRRLGVICGHLQASSSQQQQPSALVAHPTAPPPIKNKPKPEGEHVRMFSSGQQMLFAKDTGAARARVDMKVDDIQVYTIPHIKEFIADLPAVPNTWQRTRISHMNRPAIQWQFISEQEVVLADLARTKSNSAAQAFIRAGVRKTIVWKPGEVKAAIVTCGGLCPGLNDVVQELVRVLYYNYGVEDIYGIRDGYRGFYDPAYETKSWKRLTPEDVEEVHRIGGTFLGSTRGGFQLNKIVDALVAHKVNHLYIVGGDGSHRAADDIFREVYRRKLKIVVATVPKTIDNDIGVIDRSFGFNTAIEEAQKAIISARIEASCTLNGIGIVKLMGRESGMIAAHATIASREVDICLIPEVPFEMDGPYGVLAHLEHVLATQGHAVIVVSEGAGEELCGKSAGTDPSGNKILPEIGPFLRDCIKRHFSKLKKEFSIKYHDPSYMIRSVPSTASDSIYCMTLAQNAVHGAMAGYTGFVSALVNNRTVYLPVGLITATSPVYLNPRGRTWERVLSSTHQPDFLPPDSDRHKSTKVVKLLYT